MSRKLKPVFFVAVGVALALILFWFAARAPGEPPTPRNLAGQNAFIHRLGLAAYAARSYPLTDIPVIKFGENANVGSVSFETVWPLGGIVSYPPSALLMTVQSDDADDTSAGAGAQTIEVMCLDAAGFRFTETLAMNGVTPVPMAVACRRVWRANVLTAGATGTNEGDITIENGGTVYNVISTTVGGIGQNSTHSVFYTIPAERVGYMEDIGIYTQDALEVKILWTVPGLPTRHFQIRTADQIPVSLGVCFDAGTDLELQSKSELGNAEIGAIMRIYLVDSPTGLCPR